MIAYIMVFATGQIVASGVVQEEVFSLVEPLPDTQIIPNQNAQPDTGYYYDFDSETVKPFPAKPDGYYKWDYQTKTWVPDADAASLAVLAQRDKMLQESDWTQLPDVPLTEEQKTAWATYRQELRDIPEQSGYPFSINWPTPPQ